MNWRATCGVVIPCRNEEATIGRLVEEVLRYLPMVFVMDDSSSDRSVERAAAAGARVLRRERDPGKGAALREGLAAAAALGCAWGLTLDADGQHLPADIPLFLRCAEETAAPLVVGNRMQQAAAIPWFRREVNRWMSRRISALAGWPLPDSQCGFRLINLAAWQALRIEAEHFEIESEVLLGFVRAGYRVEFVVVQVVGSSRPSHIHWVADTRRWLRWWNRARKNGTP